MIEKTERNKKIYEENKTGVSYQKLAEKYGISYSMVMTICQRYKRKAMEVVSQQNQTEGFGRFYQSKG